MLVFNILVPLFMILIFGGLFQQRKARVALVAPPTANGIMRQTLPPSSFVVTAETSDGGARDAVASGRADFALVVPDSAAQASIGAPVRVAVYVSSGNQTVNGEFIAEAEQAVATLNQSLLRAPPAVVAAPETVQPAGSVGQTASYIDFLTPGVLAYAILTAGLMAAGMRLVTDRERGVLRRVRATPAPVWLFLVSHIVAQFVLIVVQVVVLLGVAHVVYGVHIAGSPVTLSILVLVGSLCFLAFGFLVAGLADGPQAAITIANLFALPQLFIAGIFFPLSQSPAWMQRIAAFMPLRYLSDGLRAIMVNGRGLGSVATDLFVLAIVGLVILALAVRTFRFDPVGT